MACPVVVLYYHFFFPFVWDKALPATDLLASLNRPSFSILEACEATSLLVVLLGVFLFDMLSFLDKVKCEIGGKQLAEWGGFREGIMLFLMLIA